MRVKSISVIVKATEKCNINCPYCFALPNRLKYGNAIMSREVVERVLKLLTEHAARVVWIWHGGEPTLLGTEYYESMQDLFFKYSAINNCDVTQSMQSNGLLYDESWAKLAERYAIDMGMSFDVYTQGIRSKDISGDSFLNKFRAFKDNNVNLGTISVVTNQNIQYLIDFYNYFKLNKLCAPAFNLIFKSGNVGSEDFLINKSIYNEEVKKYLSYWISDTSDDFLEERFANETFRAVFGVKDGVCCNFIDCRRKWLGVEPTGDLTHCDRVVPERYELGNIFDYESVNDIFNSPGFLAYYADIETRYQNHCFKCDYFHLCSGGCNCNHMVDESYAAVDSRECEQLKFRIDTGYTIIRGLDIFSGGVNMLLTEMFLRNSVMTPLEVRKALERAGYTLPEYSAESGGIVNTIEYRVMWYINRHAEKFRDYSISYTSEDLNASLRLGRAIGSICVLENKRAEWLDKFIIDRSGDIQFLFNKERGVAHECTEGA